MLRHCQLVSKNTVIFHPKTKTLGKGEGWRGQQLTLDGQRNAVYLNQIRVYE